MPIRRTAFQRHEEVTRFNGAAIDGNSRDRNVGDIQHAKWQGDFCKDRLK